MQPIAATGLPNPVPLLRKTAAHGNANKNRGILPGGPETPKDQLFNSSEAGAACTRVGKTLRTVVPTAVKKHMNSGLEIFQQEAACNH